MLESEVAPATASRLAVLVGQVQNDRDLVEAHQAGRARPRAPGRSDPAARGKAVHELADLQRCVLSESLPPRQALQAHATDPQAIRLPTVRMMVADQLRKLKQFEEAKKVLDVVYEDDPPDHEYRSVDALVHLELSRQDDPSLRERARDSIERAIRINPTLAYGWQITLSSTKRTNSGPSRRMPGERRRTGDAVRRTPSRGIVRPMNAQGRRLHDPVDTLVHHPLLGGRLVAESAAPTDREQADTNEGRA